MECFLNIYWDVLSDITHEEKSIIQVCQFVSKFFSLPIRLPAGVLDLLKKNKYSFFDMLDEILERISQTKNWLDFGLYNFKTSGWKFQKKKTLLYRGGFKVSVHKSV